MNNGKEKPGILALAMCPKRSDASWDLLPQNARTDFAAAHRSEIHRSICSSEKKPQRAKHLKHVLSLVALIFFTTSPSKSRLKSTTKKAHYCCYLWLMHSPCFQLLLPLFYSVENSCTAISSTASSTIHLQLPLSWKRSNLPPQCFFLHQISKFWTKGASALFHRNTSYV